MAQIFSKVVGQHLIDLWYHFAIMFEALFILTTIDAGTRVARYILQDFLGNLWRPLGDTRNIGANLVASGLMVCGWGYFLVQGVRDPLGGINSLWPLFGIANQMLAAIALCLATTIILKMQLGEGARNEGPEAKARRPWLALVTLIPMIWLVSVTFTAGVQKIFHGDPRVGFLAQARSLDAKAAALRTACEAAKAGGEANALADAEQALRGNRTLHFNNVLDAYVAGIFLLLVTLILLMSLREWILLLARKKLAQLRETEPVWLPDYAVKESQSFRVAGAAALAFALAKELSGEAEMERVAQDGCRCECAHNALGSQPAELRGGRARKADAQVYLQVIEKRFKGVKRCC
jgi:carbon starvation protein